MPTLPTSLARADHIRRECEKLLRALGLSLESALMAFQEPKRAAEPHLARLGQLEREADAIWRLDPHAKSYLTQLLRSTRAEADKLIARAQRAHDGRAQVQGKLQRSYNGVLGPTLSKLPGQGTAALRGQVESNIRKLIDELVPAQVTADARGVMSRELSRWALEQPAVEDAFYIIERTLGRVAGFLHEKLTIHGELVALKQRTAGQQALTPEQARTADAQAGKLAKRSLELDDLITRSIEQHALSIKAHVRLNPKLVLDPTKRFLERLDASAGITIRKDAVKIDLGARVQITNPLMFDRTSQVNLGTTLGAQVGRDLRLDASYGTTFQNGKFGGEQFKVSLTWRF